MSVSKRYIVLGASLALAGLMLVLVIGLAGAAGGTWRSVGVDGGQVYQLVTANISPTLLYARAGDPGGPRTGIWKSADGGTTWQMTSVDVDSTSGDDNLQPSVMAVSADGQTIYAATTHWPPPPAGNYSRIWRSTDGGDSWSQTQVPTSNVQSLAIFSATNRVVAGSANNDDRPLFYSTDGTTWPQATVTGPYTQVNIYTLAEGSMYAGGEARDPGLGWWVPAVYTSTEGITWTLAFTDSAGIFWGPITPIVPDPSAANRAYALDGWGGNVYSTTDRGASWTQLANQPGWGWNTRALAIDSQGRIYAATQGGPWGPPAVYRSTNNGANWGLMGQTPGQKEVSSIVVDPHDDNVLYFGSDDGRSSAGVYKTPASYQVGAAAYEFVPANSGLRAYQVNDVANNSADPNTIYAATGGQGVIRSSDGGQSWSRTSEGVTNWANAVAVHPSNANIAYFGDFGGNVYRTGDGGNIWEQRDTGLPGNRIQDLAIDPATPATLYAAITNWGGGNEGVYKTTDSALNWTATTLVTPTYAVAVHPTTPTILYAATDNEAIAPGLGIDAVYKSNDGGTNWTQLVAHNSCVFDVMVNPISPTHVYATGCNGVFLKSTDDGASWDIPVTFTDAVGVSNFPQGAWPGRLAYDSQENIIYAALGAYGLVSSDDGGQTWSQVTGDGLPSMAMLSLFYQVQNDTLFLGGSAGLWQRGGLAKVFLPIILKEY